MSKPITSYYVKEIEKLYAQKNFGFLSKRKLWRKNPGGTLQVTVRKQFDAG